jgi:hypothetical protein
MFTASRRRIEPEILDDQTPEAGARSLADLVRINRFLGGHEALRKAFRSVAPHGPFSVLDIGSATGDSGNVIRAAYPQAAVTSLDYKLHHVRHASGTKLVADAFRVPFRPRSFTFVYCSLFLHHFEDDAVVQLLRGFRDIAQEAVIINDLERHVLPYWFLPATRWIFGWDRITLHDGPISVQAGFSRAELAGLAREAGLRDVGARAHRPAFRITVVGRP